MLLRIRPSKDVLATSSGTRRRTFSVGGETLTLDFGKEPTYLDVAELPAELAADPHLITKEVTQDEMLAAGGTLTVLPGAAAAAVVEPPPGEEIDLKSERVQEPAAAVAPSPEPAATSVAPLPKGTAKAKK